MGNFTFLSLGGIGTVTKNMHLYIVGNEILIVDCGIGFAQETTLGVDLLLPDISPLQELLKQGKTIVGMVITHGHEDHMGALPFLLPQLPEFPIFATSFTTVMANEKLRQFNMQPVVQKASFRKPLALGKFTCEFIHVTHSIPDTAHIFIQTSLGNYYHGSDFKFDLTPTDGKHTDFAGIIEAGKKGVTCLISESLGADRHGITPSEQTLKEHFVDILRNIPGRALITTYASHIQRINLIAEAARETKRSICFVGRSFLKTRDLAMQEGLLTFPKEQEISIDKLKKIQDKNILLFIAGSQGQENSALDRIVNNEHRDVHLKPTDTIIFSADPIPGNEPSVTALIDSLSKQNMSLVYEPNANKYHVSGHGSQQETLLLMSLLKPQNVLPISGNFRHQAAYKKLARTFGFTHPQILMPDSGQEVIFQNDKAQLGRKLKLRTIYVDEVSGEELEHYVLHDRKQISQEGIVAVIAEIDSTDGTLVDKAQVIIRGITGKETQDATDIINDALQKGLKPGVPIADWNYMRKKVRELTEQAIISLLHRKPLILPIVIEV